MSNSPTCQDPSTRHYSEGSRDTLGPTNACWDVESDSDRYRKLFNKRTAATPSDLQTSSGKRRKLRLKSGAKPPISAHKQRQATQREQQDIYDLALQQLPVGANHIISRHSQHSCHALDRFDSSASLNTRKLKLSKDKTAYFKCYQCHRASWSPHPVYLFMCHACGDTNQGFRHLSRDLGGQVALVTGARTKLGHQCALKLLRSGATVVGTTRNTAAARRLFTGYHDSARWIDCLQLVHLDLDSLTLATDLAELVAKLRQDLGIEALDIVVNCAAQTIRARDKPTRHGPAATGSTDEHNRYGDSKFVHSSDVNSWQMRLEDLRQAEMEEVFRINAVAPVLLLQQLMPLLRKSDTSPYVINVHAREGLMEKKKGDMHLHTNMAKAALHMATKCLSGEYSTLRGDKIRVHGCDPGWISVDEYFEEQRPWVVPPLDEVDGAARILYPLFRNIKGSCQKTRRHFNSLSY